MLVDIKTEEFHQDDKLVAVEYCLYINGKREGYIGIDVTNKKNYVTVSQVNSRYRGRGFGKMLYLTALENHGKISTRYHRCSKLAQYVWDSLVTKYAYRTDFFTDTLTVYNRHK
jgi:GNAT superfamily N-acetyltransferase